ncbi:CRISPR-associated endonuclease/helicase Cas3 [Prosthecobacter fusiformis]|uniref:CRISPR-associated endonuclease/helicase Cas3 n=1 Tax=Prosthecobacter fusiformis TaxID=48464 RepID=A0A4R7RS50_9BACT|nr:CRISPR-associated endonuclease Cas3'' [Prosthecobacter fusiformis]TDU67137.1 CRISPR-associated endonuclease/helicase Cas3 [Prosthecobacter fusiformis]
MPAPDFSTFFSTASGPDRQPYDYQSRLAAEPCQSRLISIPTGLGKTAAVVLAWLWNRVGHPQADHRNQWPRRLVYCLPMRTLVEQTRDEAKKWLEAHGLLWDGKEPHTGKVGLHILMGGEDADPWDLYPEEDAILIGTQDMLLSRTLNRGYGMSRYRWPMHFGLLNNDCLWVLDETQLMGVGVETSAQLDGFRHLAKWLQYGPCQTWWMSATLEDARLATVDHPMPTNGWPKLMLSDEEKASGRPFALINAKKQLCAASLKLSASNKSGYARQLATYIHKLHREGTLTLVILNRVARAREVYEALTTPEKKGKQSLPPLVDSARVALIHSRFRPVDRDRHTRLLFGEGDRIVIATQAVEAGVDVSARLLISELAPWSSLVQRIGRCNRRADQDDAAVQWIDFELKNDKDDLALPYTKAELDKARAALQSLTDASPQSLSGVRVEGEKIIRPVIRRRDLLDLFDTTPDLCGQDLDISRYIRDGEDSDVQFFWRDFSSDAPAVAEPQPQRSELCRVSIGDASKFLKGDKASAWHWNALDKKWESSKVVRPGGVYLLHVSSGGYADALGWTGDSKTKPTAHPPALSMSPEGYPDDYSTFARYDLSYQQHVDGVIQRADAIVRALCMKESDQELLRLAALWHDAGKAHRVFQKMLCGEEEPAILRAKSALKVTSCDRYGFRHELASALAFLIASPVDTPQRDLAAYIIAAHHGKVRLSIRSLPGEKGDGTAPARLFTRGIWDGDALPPVPGLTAQSMVLDLSVMLMGEGQLGRSWLARMISLRDELGPFTLAYLESLLRSADMRTSAAEATEEAVGERQA